LAAELTAKASTPEEKVAALFEYCRANIRNVVSVRSGVTDAERREFKVNKNAGDTLKQKLGTGSDMNHLFAALAIAAGFDARLVRLAPRTQKTFVPQMMSLHFLAAEDIAVKIGDAWHFFDAAALRTPRGLLRWEEEGVTAPAHRSQESGVRPDAVRAAGPLARSPCSRYQRFGRRIGRRHVPVRVYGSSGDRSPLRP
jgi:hypothetical protein